MFYLLFLLMLFIDTKCVHLLVQIFTAQIQSRPLSANGNPV